jgi:hypothetical protein
MTEAKLISQKELLAKLDTPKELKDVNDWFSSLAIDLIRNYELHINKKVYKLVELEFYLYTDNHPDPYVHRNELQLKTLGNWYFHRENSAKKTFTLKGVDITFGTVNKDYGGILIRCIMDVETKELIEGPSKVVDQILTCNDVESVLELKELNDNDWNISNPILKLVPSTNKTRCKKMMRGPRVGLKSKSEDSYLDRNYRYRIYAESTKKNKKSIVGGELVKEIHKKKIVITSE